MNPNYQLFPHQSRALNFMKEMTRKQIPGGILDIAPGLGKTLITYSHLYSFGHGHNLIIVPLTVLCVWKCEKEKFFGKSNDVLYAHYYYDGNLKNFTEDELKKYKIVITTYSSISSLWTKKIQNDEIFHDLPWKWNVYCDEVHVLRNPKSQKHHHIQYINRDNFWGMTGSLIHNTVDEVPILQSLIHKRYMYLKDVRISITVEDAEISLPTLSVKTIPVPMRRRQRKLYNDELSSACTTISTYGNKNLKAWNTYLKRLNCMRSIAITPSLLNSNENEWNSHRSPKIERVCDDIEQKEGLGIVFCFYRNSLEMTRKNLEERGISCCIMKSEHSPEERSEIIEDFRNKKFEILLTTFMTGGLGLNMSFCQNVYFLSVWWNMEVILQALKRCWRIGQKEDVYVRIYLTQNSVEDMMWKICQSKYSNTETFLRGDHGNQSVTPNKNEQFSMMIEQAEKAGVV